MSHQPPLKTRDLEIVHVTNLGDEEYPAFVHALGLARASESNVLSLHANDDPTSLSRMPDATEVLARWEQADGRGGRPLHRCVVSNCCDDAVDTLLRAVREARPDLLVATTHPRKGIERAFLGSVAEGLALEVSCPTLFVPSGARPFVADATGKLTLRRVLVTAGDPDAANTGAAYAAWLSDVTGVDEVAVELLHVGPTAAPTAQLPERTAVRYSTEHIDGPLVETIIARAHALDADLIVMPTRGHDSLRDVFAGSHTERVLHHAPCPVLSVPLR